MLYTLNLFSGVCQLFFSKAVKTKKKKKGNVKGEKK